MTMSDLAFVECLIAVVVVVVAAGLGLIWLAERMRRQRPRDTRSPVQLAADLAEREVGRMLRDQRMRRDQERK